MIHAARTEGHYPYMKQNVTTTALSAPRRLTRALNCGAEGNTFIYMDTRPETKAATCRNHANRTVYARGLCNPCYQRERYRTNRVARERSRDSARAWQSANYKSATIRYGETPCGEAASALHENIRKEQRRRLDEALLLVCRDIGKPELERKFLEGDKEVRAFLKRCYYAWSQVGVSDQKATARKWAAENRAKAHKRAITKAA